MIKFIWFGFMALLFMASCENGTIYTENNEVAAATIVASAPDCTKAYADGVSVKWQKDDKLYVLNDDDLNNTWEYTLSEGADGTRGTFTYSGTGEALSSSAAVHAIFAMPYGWESNQYKFYVEAAPALYGYDDSDSKSSDGKLKIPMMASGSVGSELVFTHLASLVRIELTNNLGKDITISSIRLSSGVSGSLAGILQVNPNEEWAVSLSGGSGASIISDGNVSLAASETKTFDFVVIADTYSDFVVDVITSDDELYKFAKSSFTAVKGNAHVFNAVLTDSKKSCKNYLIFIDGKDYRQFNIGEDITVDSGIVLKPNLKTSISSTDYTSLLEKNVTKLMDVDLSNLDYSDGAVWKRNLGNKNVRNMYLPKNVTSINGNYWGKTCVNMRLHVSKNLVDIAECQFNNSNSIYNEGSGFYVDADNPNYSSENGILYNKEGTTLLQYPSYNRDTIEVREGVEVLKGYCLANNPVEKAVICPSTLKEIGNSTFYATSKLSTIIVKSVTPLTLNDTHIGATSGTVVAGVIIVDTGNDNQDIKSKEQYVMEWKDAGKIGSWIIQTKAENLNSTGSAGLTELNSNSDYSTSLW